MHLKVHANHLNMSDQPPAFEFDDSSIEWETLSSKNGVPFKVGRPKIDNAAEEKIKVLGKEDFSITG